MKAFTYAPGLWNHHMIELT